MKCKLGSLQKSLLAVDRPGMLTALLKWMQHSRKDQRFNSLATSRRRTPREVSLFDRLIPESWRALLRTSEPGRTLNLDTYEDRVLYSAAPAPAPEAAPSQAVSVAPILELPQPIVTSGQPAVGETNGDQTAGAASDTISDWTSLDLIVIDPTIPDAETLIAKLAQTQSEPNRILVLDGQRDGLQQIADRLEELGQTQAIHIVSHGDESGLRLGSNWLSGDTLPFREATLGSWKPFLADNADLLFYGCDLAGNESGQAFLRHFGELTGTDVAASTDATGSLARGGNWNLEFQFGSIETQSLGEQLQLFDWNGLLTANSYQEGASYTGTQDTSLNTSNPANTYGTSPAVIVGGAEQQTGLLRFDNLFGNGPNQIPLGSTILSATLQLNVLSGAESDATIALHRVLTSWSESSSYSSLGSGLSRDGQEVSTVADALVQTPNASGIQSISGLQDALQAWSNGAANLGWAIYGDNSTSWAFTSSEGATAALRPMLQVSYEPPVVADVELRSTGEIRVNATTTDTQSTLVDTRNPHNSVGVDANGNYVVVWTSANSDGSGSGVFAQRYNARGVAQGRPILVNTTTTGDQKWGSIAVRSDGGFIVTWTSVGQDGSLTGTYARIFNSSGVGGSEIQVNSTTTGDQYASTVDVAADGSFVVVWRGSGSGDSTGIFFQRFDSSGTKQGGEQRVNTTTLNTQEDPSVAMGQDGQFMVVWDDIIGTYGRRFDASGGALDGSQLLIHADATSGNADVATNGTGDYHIVWRTTGNGDGSGRGLWMSSISSTDTAAGTPLSVTTDTINDQTEPAISSDADGNYIITWQGSGPGDTAGVFARKFLNDGTAVGTEYQLNETVSGSQVGVSTALINLDNSIAVWSGNGPGDASGIFMRAEGTLKNQASLLFTTSHDVTGSGSSSLPDWTTGDVLAIGQPNLTLGDNTSGTLSIVGNINAIANDGNVSIAGLDVIQHDVLVAAGAHQVQLYAGDVLFSVASQETLGTLSVQSDDILIFRPAAPWNYAAGSISVLFDGIQSVGGGTVQAMADFDLVDADTQVGDVFLTAGTLLVADSGGGSDVVQIFHPTDAGLTTTTGTTQTLLKGSEVPIGQAIAGLHLVERDVQVGGVSLESGDLLVAMQSSTTIGTNGLPVTSNDVARLKIRQTSVNGTAVVSASTLVDGSDVALDSNQESILGLALIHVGDNPISADDTYHLTEGQTFHSQDMWHLSGWSSRQRLTFDNSSRAENLDDFPVLVTLDTNRFDYSQAKSNGADLRFVDANGTSLSYEIEGWNTSGQSHIWVKVPRIDARSATDSIWMYFGNSAASDAQNAADVWSNGYVGVWHMNNNPAGTSSILDSTSSNRDGTAVGMDSSNQINSPIGSGYSFDGTSEAIRIISDATDPLAIDGNQLTVEAWANSTGNTGTWETIVNRRRIDVVPIDSYGLMTTSSDPTAINFSSATTNTTTSTGAFPGDRWRQITGTVSGATASVYVDGQLVKTSSLSSSVVSNDDDVTIGAGENGFDSTLSQYWKGGIDEVRLSNVARSAAWTSAQYASMTDTMISYGDRQTVAGLLDNDSTSTSGGLFVSRVSLSGVSDFDSITVLDNGQVVADPGAAFESLAAGETTTRQFQYTVMDGNGNSDLGTATLVVTGTNDAPVLDPRVGPLTLTTISEDAVANVGNTVSQIITSASGTLITDVDTSDPRGIAVTGADNSHGTWQYSVNGTTWTSFSAVSDTSATLLDASARIRFVPQANFNGIGGTISFRAWDQSSGTSGQSGVDVSVNGGTTAYSTATASATVQVTAVNDAPSLTIGTGLSVLEGGQIGITAGSLNATDVDNTPSQLIYTVTGGLGFGHLALSNAPGTAISSFTQAQINSGLLLYVHDGADSVSDYVSLSVSDGSLTGTGTLSFNITPVNDAPTFDANRIIISEGQSITLSTFNLLTNDPDTPASSLVYTVNSVSNGRFERVASPGLSISTFTQDDINGSRIRFIHNGGEAAPSATLSVTDGNTAVGPRSMAMTFTNVNDPPTISTPTNQNLQAGQSTPALAFNVGDAETPANLLLVTASSSDTVRIPLSGIVLSGTGANRTVTITPAPTAIPGTVQITLTVSDGTTTTSTVFSVTILAAPAPNAVNDSYTLNEDSTLDTQAQGWWNSQWTVRHKLALNNSGRTESLQNFPILVTLDPAHFDYSQAAANGADLRFVDRDGTVLNYDIETWNASGTSRIWVKVPQIDASSDSDYLWLYAGNSSAASGANPSGVWGSDYEAVYHFNQNPGSPGTLSDSTGQWNGNISGATSAIGLVGGGYSFDGVSSTVSLPANSPILANSSAISFSTWIRPSDLNGTQSLLSIGVNSLSPTTTARLAVYLNGSDFGSVIRTQDNSTGASLVTNTGSLVANEWQYVTVVADLSANSESIYLNGGLVGTVSGIFLTTSLPGTDATASTIGSDSWGNAGNFAGLLDEMRLQSVVRSADWVSAEYASMTGNLVSMGGESFQAGVLDNDSDPQQDSLTAVLLTGPNHALNFTFNGYGSFTYTPSADFSGDDSFTYQARDPGGNLSTATVTLHVAAVPDAPRTTGLPPVNVGEDAPNTVLRLSDYFSDPDGDALAFSVDSNSNTGLFRGVSINPVTQELTLAYGPNLSGAANLVLRATDSTGRSTTTTLQVTVSAVNDAPAIAKNTGLTLPEGGSELISAARLSTTDLDNTASQLIYTLTAGPTHGRVEKTTNPGVSITSFKQSDIDAGLIRYVHDGSETSGDSLAFTVSDGTASVSGTFAITVTPVNDPPVFVANSISIIEGQAIVLSTSNIDATDPDSSTLTFSVSGMSHGQFRNTSTNSIVTSFTRAELQSGVISFTHDGSEQPPVAAVAVSDGSLTTTPVAMSFTYSPVNDAPVVVTNTGATVSEGGVILISNGQLSAIDSDNPATQLTYAITYAPQHGRLERVSSPGAVITSFTQDEINQGAIRYVHGGRETLSDTFSFTVSDGVVSVTGQFPLTITPVNDVPQLILGTLNVSQGATVQVTTAAINASDPDSQLLTYTVSAITHGQFLDTSTGLAVTSFTNADISSGHIAFVHDNSELGPGGLVQVGDGVATSPSQPLLFNFFNINSPPVIADQAFTIAENSGPGAVVGQVLASDPDLRDRFSFSILPGSSSGLFTIDASTGQLAVASGAILDFEAQSAHSLNVVVRDLSGASSVATVTVQLLNVNEQPVSMGFQRMTSEEDGPPLTLDLNTKFSDPEAAKLSFRIVSQSNPSLFSGVTISADGQMTLTSSTNANGTCDLVVEASDPGGLPVTSTLSVVVSPVNDAPVAASVLLGAMTGGTLTIVPSVLLQSAFDVDGDRLTVVMLSQPAHGTLTANPDGTFTYQATSGFTGTETVSYAVTDGQAMSRAALLSFDVQVLAVNFNSGSGSYTGSTTGMSTVNVDNSINSSETSSAVNTISSTTTSPPIVIASTSLPGGGNAASSGSDPGAVGESHSHNQELIGPISTQKHDDDFAAFGSNRNRGDQGEIWRNSGKSTTDGDPGRQRGHWDRFVDQVQQAGPASAVADLFSGSTATPISQLREIFSSQSNVAAFDQLTDSMASSELQEELIFEVPALAGATLTMGYVVWMLRGGMLVTSLLAQMPAWKIIDPLVVLDSLDKAEGDDESLGSLVEQGQSESENG